VTPAAALWLRAARPATLSAAVAPVLVGSAVAFAAGGWDLAIFVAALTGAVLIQVGANYANDLSDFLRGTDGPGRLGPPRVAATGVATPREIALATAFAFAGATACGAYLAITGGPPVIVVGLAAMLAALTYVGGPWPYGYHGLGDLACFAFFGPVPVATIEWLHRGTVGTAGIAASLAVGAVVTAILVVNNVRDINEDRRARKRTLAVLIGEDNARREWEALLAAAYLIVAAGGAALLWAWPAVVLPALTVPFAWRLRQRFRASTGRALNAVLRDTARLHLAFGGLFAAGVALSRLGAA